jgi:hypothetical protein
MREAALLGDYKHDKNRKDRYQKKQEGQRFPLAFLLANREITPAPTQPGSQARYSLFALSIT